MVEWGRYAEAYKAIHDKIAEVLTKLDAPADPQTVEVIASIVLSVVQPTSAVDFADGSPNVQYVIKDKDDHVIVLPIYGYVFNGSTWDKMRGTAALGLLTDISDDSTREIGGVSVKKIATQKKIDLTATGVIYTPASGKKIRLLGFQWSQSTASVISALRFGTGGDLLFPIQTNGVMAMNLINAAIEGAVNEALYGYLSASGVMKGTVLIEEV